MLYLYPLLLSLYPPLFYLSHNLHHALPGEILPLIYSTPIAALLLLFGFWFLVRDRNKAALMVSWTIMLFFTYGHLLRGLRLLIPNSILIQGNLPLYTLWLILLFLGLYLIKKIRLSLDAITSIMSLVTVVLLIFPLYNILYYQLNRPGNVETEMSADQKLRVPEPAPDIYYLILDGYASSSTLKKLYGTPNQDFYQQLEERGFQLKEDGYSNYALTFLSLASSLNMDYLKNLIPLPAGRNQLKPYQLIDNSRVFHAFNQLGYTTINYDSGWSGTISNSRAEYNPSPGSTHNHFLYQTLRTTMLRPLISGDRARERIIFTLSSLAEIGEKKEGPVFAMAHLLPPHPPYLFDSQGKAIHKGKRDLAGDLWQYREEYIEQLKYINQEILQLIDRLKESEGPSPIIILQADHGPASLGEWEHPSAEFIQERMGILLALKLPETDNMKLEIKTPINIFPLIFNMYFNSQLPLLEEKVLFSSYHQPYQLKDVSSLCLPESE